MRAFNNDYSDILNLDYPRATDRVRMSMENRAAQFSPFAALTGLDDAMDETAKKAEEYVLSHEYDF